MVHISMGKGDVAVMFCSDREDRQHNGISFVKRAIEYPVAVDMDCDLSDEEIEKGTLGHITFSNPKSIDAVITQLLRLKEKMHEKRVPICSDCGHSRNVCSECAE
ncbi:hypothetical protein [Brevibacillus sp. DP1.3A]|uniref:hypothetical protein n=1 Tax=Brevibacillus sp. DP1.3A TaxID=2738867 RepID=UPI00156B5D2D|nr:hypothetical protein [Brevibacillus sp. DP1.3A]UED78095.1 hypothetical protein HP399_030690 [Brevibacillus sp. DP1.3A]